VWENTCLHIRHLADFVFTGVLANSM
jgi:hypothetical protein